MKKSERSKVIEWVKKAKELSWLEPEDKAKLISEIETKGMTENQVLKVVNMSKAFLHLFDKFPDEIRGKLLKEIKPKLFTKGMNKAEIIHDINEVTGSSQKLKEAKIPIEMFKTQKEADDEYFVPRGGRCLGRVAYWYGTIDPIRDKSFKKKKKEEEKKRSSTKRNT